MEVYFKRRLVLSEEISVLRMSVKIYNQAMQENTLDTFTISDWRNKRFMGKLDKQTFFLFFFTCHDDVKDAGFPLFPHGVGGSAEEGPIVHGVLRGVAQATLPTIALGSLIGHPGHEILHTGSHMGVTPTHWDSSITFSHTQPFGSAFL